MYSIHTWLCICMHFLVCLPPQRFLNLLPDRIQKNVTKLEVSKVLTLDLRCSTLTTISMRQARDSQLVLTTREKLSVRLSLG